MKPLLSCLCLALGLFRGAAAQFADPFAFSGGITINNSTLSRSPFTLGELTLKPGKLPLMVEQIQFAWSALTPEKLADLKAAARKDSNLPEDALVNRLYLDITGRQPRFR